MNNRVVTKGTNGSPCGTDNDCSYGYLCDGGNGAIGSGICAPIPKSGQFCSAISNRCGAGDTCSQSDVVDTNGMNVFPSINESIQSVAPRIVSQIKKQYVNYLLLSDGRITTIDSNYNVQTFNTNLKVEQILVFDKWIFGLDRMGTLYQRKFETHTYGNINWRWVQSQWAPSDINHMSRTIDGNNLWLQAPHQSDLNSQFNPNLKYYNTIRGFLYKVGVNTPTLIQQCTVGNIIRNYGKDQNNYLDINPSNETAVKQPGNTIVNDIITGLLLNNGQVVKISPQQYLQYSNVQLIVTNSNGQLTYNPVFITQRVCE